MRMVVRPAPGVATIQILGRGDRMAEAAVRAEVASMEAQAQPGPGVETAEETTPAGEAMERYSWKKEGGTRASHNMAGGPGWTRMTGGRERRMSSTVSQSG